MAQVCFACAYGLTRVTPKVVPVSANAGDILGVCWECHVLGCYEHAQRDAGSGKWKCFPSIAKALLTSAQIPTGTAAPALGADPPISDDADFEIRFPELALASRQSRLGFRAHGELRFNRTERAWELFTDALGVAELIVYGSGNFQPKYMITARPGEAPAPEDIASAVLTLDLLSALRIFRNA